MEVRAVLFDVGGVLDDSLVRYVRSLHPRVRTAILSNSADGARREETRRYGFPDLVDEIIYSDEVGLAKPDPAIYALACARLHVEPWAAAFVDDLQVNVDAAARLGIHAVLHRSTPDTIAALDRLLDQSRPSRGAPRA